MRLRSMAVGLGVALAVGAASLALAQAPSLDLGKVARYEARLRGNYITRLTICDYVLPAIARESEASGARLRENIEIAQACWNVQPSVLGAFTLARFWELDGEAAAADAAITTAQARFPADGALMLVGRAGRAARAGQAEEADRLLNQAISLGPPNGDRDPDNWTTLASPLLGGDNIGALRIRIFDEAWRRADARRDRDEKVRVLRARANVYLEEERPADALADMDRAMPFTSDSDRSGVLLVRARAKQRLGDSEGARQDFAQAVAATPSVASDEASYRRQRAADLAPAACRPAVRAANGLNTGLQGDVDAVMRAADECVAAGHAAIGLTYKAGERIRLGDREQGMALLDQAIAADAGYAPAYAAKAAALRSAEQFEAARAALDQAISLAPQNAQYLFERAEILITLGDRAAARADQERGLGLDPRRESDLAAYVGNLIALEDHRCAVQTIDATNGQFFYGSATLTQLRPLAWSNVRQMPRDQRACTAPVALGRLFEF